MKLIITSMLAAAVAAGVIPASQVAYEGAPTSTVETHVYVNGEPLTHTQQARLEALIGETVPDGRYVLLANGMFGYEGRSERVDLAAYMRARQSGGARGDNANDDHATSMYSRDAAGQGSTFTAYGNCVSMSTPTGTFLGSGC